LSDSPLGGASFGEGAVPGRLAGEDFTHFDTAIDKLPRRRVGFYPTPFHALPNVSDMYGINFFLKREDLAGPSAISGSKTRLAEFILGRALEEGVTHLITQGAYLTNSGLQFAAACLSARITPILVLTRNVPRHGELGEPRGNYLLNQTMGVETHVINVSGTAWTDPEAAARVADTIEDRKAELEAQGHKVLVVGTGGAHPDGFIAHALAFREMLEQSTAAGVELDFIYHTIGTGTALPGMLAAKLSLGHPVKFRSIAINGYNDDDWMNPAVIVERTKAVLTTLDAPAPDDAAIRAEIDIDQRFHRRGLRRPHHREHRRHPRTCPGRRRLCRPRLHRQGLGRAPPPRPQRPHPRRQQRRIPAHRRHRQPLRDPRSRRTHHQARRNRCAAIGLDGHVNQSGSKPPLPGQSMRCRLSCDRQASRPVAHQMADMRRTSAVGSQMAICGDRRARLPRPQGRAAAAQQLQ